MFFWLPLISVWFPLDSCTASVCLYDFRLMSVRFLYVCMVIVWRSLVSEWFPFYACVISDVLSSVWFSFVPVWVSLGFL